MLFRSISTDRARRAVWVRRVNRSTAKRCHNTCSIELLVRGIDDVNDGRSAWARTGVTCSSGSGSAEIVGRRGPLLARQASPGVLPSRRTVSRVFWPVGLLPPSGCVCCQACQGCGQGRSSWSSIIRLHGVVSLFPPLKSCLSSVGRMESDTFSASYACRRPGRRNV